MKTFPFDREDHDILTRFVRVARSMETAGRKLPCVAARNLHFIYKRRRDVSRMNLRFYESLRVHITREIYGSRFAK